MIWHPLLLFQAAVIFYEQMKQLLGKLKKVVRNSIFSDDDKTGAWFVYDGECPLCNSAAQAFRMKREYGSIHLVDARKSADDPLIQEINKRGLDLDEGMVIYARGRFFYGKSALKFMAQYGDSRNVFMVFCKSLFWSDTISSLTYPWMRSVRNWLLRRQGIGQIDNLNSKNTPD